MAIRTECHKDGKRLDQDSGKEVRDFTTVFFGSIGPEVTPHLQPCLSIRRGRRTDLKPRLTSTYSSHFLRVTPRVRKVPQTLKNHSDVLHPPLPLKAEKMIHRSLTPPHRISRLQRRRHIPLRRFHRRVCRIPLDQPAHQRR